MKTGTYLLICCIAAAMQARAATYTSVANGSWSDPQTWGGAGVPGINDNAVVRNTVTVDVDTQVGTSPATDKSATAYAVRIVHTNTTTQRGELIVANGVTLTARGDIRMESSNSLDLHALYQMNPGSKLVFDSSAASDPNGPLYRIYTPDPSNNTYRSSWVRFVGTAQNPVKFDTVSNGRISTNGIPNNHMLVEQRNGGSSAYGLVDVLIQFAEIEDCGSQLAGCLQHATGGSTYPGNFVVEDTTLTRTSGIKPTSPQFSDSVSPPASFILKRVKTFNTYTTGDTTVPGYIYGTSRGSFSLNTSQPKTTGTRLVEDCYFDQGQPSAGLYSGFVFRRVIWDRYPPAINGADGVVEIQHSADLLENSVFRALNVSARGALARNIAGLYFYGDDRPGATGNPHGITVGLKGDVTIDRFIFEYAQSVSDPNAIWSQAYPTTGGPYTYQHTYSRMILLPISNSLTSVLPSGVGPNPIQARTFPRLRMLHNTMMFGGNAGDYAKSSYIAESGCPVPGAIEEYKSNIMWGTAGVTNYAWQTHTGDPTCRFTAGGPPWIAPNILMPANITNNSCANCSTVPSSLWATWANANPSAVLTNIGTVYNVPTTGTVPGAGDLPSNQDPQFVDIRRNMKTWCDEMTGQSRGTCTANDAMAYLANGPDTLESRVNSLFTWVSEGFRPTNSAFRGSAHDGGDIGAVPLIPADNFAGINNPIVIQ